LRLLSGKVFGVYISLAARDTDLPIKLVPNGDPGRGDDPGSWGTQPTDSVELRITCRCIYCLQTASLSVGNSLYQKVGSFSHTYLALNITFSWYCSTKERARVHSCSNILVKTEPMDPNPGWNPGSRSPSPCTVLARLSLEATIQKVREAMAFLE
jgi:hypothetical protein